MRIVFVLLASLSFTAFADEPASAGLLLGGQTERISSDNTITNKAWRRDVVQVRNGQLSDPTGTLVAKADVDFLSEVESGITQIHQAGTNGFKRAADDFRTAISNHPPTNACLVSAVFKPYSTLRPADKNLYIYLVSESTMHGSTNELHWFFSRPFTLKPRMLAQDIYIGSSGNVVTNYSECPFVNYYPEATNAVPPVTEGDWGRVIRTYDPPCPVAGATLRRDHHLQFGHPENGFNPGNLNMAVRPNASTSVCYGVTGTYTDSVNRVEYKFDKGTVTKREAY